MKFLRKFLDNQAKHFEKGGKFALFFPVFEMADTILYTTGKRTDSAAHIRDALDLKRMMILVVYALVPATLMGIYNAGYQANFAAAELGKVTSELWQIRALLGMGLPLDATNILSNIVLGLLYFLPIYIITLATGGVWEVLFAVVRKEEVNEGFLVTSLLFPLICPPTIPYWQVVLGVSFGVVIGKEVFGGVGMNIFNPALMGRAFLFFAYPAQISGDKVWVGLDGISQATVLAAKADPLIQESYTWWNAFVGMVPGSIGETSALACLIGAAVLIATGIGSWRIMLGTVIGLVSMSTVFNLIGSDSNAMFAVSPWWHMVIGGYAFGAVFMATDPVSATYTSPGKWIYGILIGVLVVLVRVVNPAFPEGMMLAILFMNAFAPIIDKIYLNQNIKRRLARDVE